MSRWWRAHDEAVDDPKLGALTDRQHRAWFNLCCITSQNGGVLPAISAIAFKLRTTVEKARTVVAELVALGLFDIDSETGKCAPHNWAGRQFQSDVSTTRVQRFRERKRNVSPAVSETPPETEADTDNRTEKKEKTRASALAVGWPADFREQFWARYPNKVGKPKAIAKLENCMRRGLEFSAIMDGLDRYIRSKPADRAWLNPETFINQERWADQPAMVTNGQRAFDPARRSSSADFFAGMSSVAADIAGYGESPGSASEEIPLGRVNIDG